MIHRFTIDVSYRQFEVQDVNANPGDFVAVWEQPSSMPGYMVEGNIIVPSLGTIQGGILVCPARDGDGIEVEIEILNHRPTLDFDAWDHVLECSIDIPSGRIQLQGLMSYREPAILDLSPGTYSALVFYGGFDTLDEYELTGDDHYRVTLWPGTYIEPRLIK